MVCTTKKSRSKKIKKQKEKQRKALKIIHEELKKSEQFHVSLDGLEKLSDSSIKSIQNKRKKSVLMVIKEIHELSSIIRELEKSENRYSNSMN